MFNISSTDTKTVALGVLAFFIAHALIARSRQVRRLLEG
jgi:hypothetical protein